MMNNTMMSNAMMTAINAAFCNTEKYYVAEIIGSNVIRVTCDFVLRDDAEKAKRRMNRRGEGKYRVMVVA